MATVEITQQNFNDVISDNDVVILDFWASWCGPCKRYAPIYEAMSEKHPDIVFGKVNTEEQQQLAASFGIRSIPSTVFFREQLPIHLQPGLLPEEGLADLIKQVQGLDMETVKAEMAKRQAEQSPQA